ncbi:hypothetical protein SNE40_004710 [Patella caerulea]|uniref:Uncharacterized protein n=1 Tax=Patella caerulea TaxID=87958 RepID=A0AAN8K9X6_PATCE
MEFPALHPQTSPNSGITFTNSASESTDDKDSINEPSYEHQGDNPREENNPGANTTIPTKNKTTKTNVDITGQVKPAKPGSLNQDLSTLDSIKTTIVNNDNPIVTSTINVITNPESHTMNDVNKSIIDTGGWDDLVV